LKWTHNHVPAGQVSTRRQDSAFKMSEMRARLPSKVWYEY